MVDFLSDNLGVSVPLELPSSDARSNDVKRGDFPDAFSGGNVRFFALDACFGAGSPNRAAVTSFSYLCYVAHSAGPASHVRSLATTSLFFSLFHVGYWSSPTYLFQ